jgi:hypothetical protein
MTVSMTDLAPHEKISALWNAPCATPEAIQDLWSAVNDARIAALVSTTTANQQRLVQLFRIYAFKTGAMVAPPAWFPWPILD